MVAPNGMGVLASVAGGGSAARAGCPSTRSRLAEACRRRLSRDLTEAASVCEGPRHPAVTSVCEGPRHLPQRPWKRAGGLGWRGGRGFDVRDERYGTREAIELLALGRGREGRGFDVVLQGWCSLLWYKGHAARERPSRARDTAEEDGRRSRRKTARHGTGRRSRTQDGRSPVSRQSRRPSFTAAK